MNMLANLWTYVQPIVPTTIAITAALIILFVANGVLQRRQRSTSGFRLTSQIIMMGLVLVCIVLVIVALPVGDTLRGQLLTFLGILLSVAVALSSTTFLGNAMGGIMLRAVRNFRTGDFIQSEEHFGRVSERGLFHTEIQTENRDLITLPNFFLVTHPVTTIRSSGTVVSTTVSLGYNVPRDRVKKALLEAAAKTGLQEPFVRIAELGDFSVTYRIAGLLTEVKQLLTARSRLRGAAMDTLHENGIEIVSPTFMNTRAIDRKREFIPHRSTLEATGPIETTDAAPEDFVFDKAEEAESLESLRRTCDTLDEGLVNMKKALKDESDPEAKTSLEARRDLAQRRLDHLREAIARREKAADDTD